MDARRMLCSVACTHSFDVDYNNAIPKSVMPGRGEGIYEILSVLSSEVSLSNPQIVLCTLPPSAPNGRPGD